MKFPPARLHILGRSHVCLAVCLAVWLSGSLPAFPCFLYSPYFLMLTSSPSSAHFGIVPSDLRLPPLVLSEPVLSDPPSKGN